MEIIKKTLQKTIDGKEKKRLGMETIRFNFVILRQSAPDYILLYEDMDLNVLKAMKRIF